MISFEKTFEYSDKPVRMNIYFKGSSTALNYNLTIGTYMNHPKKGKTQMFRRQVGRKTLIKLLKNPRQHTGRGYQKK